VPCRIVSFRNLTLSRQVIRRVGPPRAGRFGLRAYVDQMSMGPERISEIAMHAKLGCTDARYRYRHAEVDVIVDVIEVNIFRPRTMIVVQFVL